ncbi:hypothetical protein [Methylophaga sp. UBA2689]|uniref:hypothetical protein n=1 Tax=Methylophaga sp. UBA2689 TaxID=1946878 RepID=UPI0025E9A280|nr:hypothetical protein [Methylophaga sp. UBA2689]|tara:strand:+ start:432 stop:797 length:366 start_codon:yes stop_codon:yes gene_type:complete
MSSLTGVRRYDLKRRVRIAKLVGEDFGDDLDFAPLERTAHAQQRAQDRGVSKEMEILLQMFGAPEMQKGETEILKVPKKALKALRKAVDKLEKYYVVINPEINTAITYVPEYKKIRTVRNQ